MDKMTELIKLLTACVSVIPPIISLVHLSKNKKDEGRSAHTNLVGSNSGTVNQYANSNNYTDNRSYVNKTQIVYNTTSGKESISGDIAFLAVIGILWFPFSRVLEENLWILQTIMILVQVIVAFCIYKKVQICLPSEKSHVNLMFLISPSLLIIMSIIPSIIGLGALDFGDAFLASLWEKIYQTGSLLLTYSAFLIMFLSQICSLISPKVIYPAFKRFLEGISRLWGTALFFEILSLSLVLMSHFIVYRKP